MLLKREDRAMSERLSDAELVRIDEDIAMAREISFSGRLAIRAALAELRAHREREPAVRELMRVLRWVAPTINDETLTGAQQSDAAYAALADPRLAAFKEKNSDAH